MLEQQPSDGDENPTLLDEGTETGAGTASSVAAHGDRRTASGDGGKKPVAPKPDADAVDLVPSVDARDPAADDKALVNETFLPVHDLGRLSSREMRVISHPAFQRLFEIFQLGQTRVVYRGATHMRGEHSVGALQVVTLMADALARSCAA